MDVAALLERVRARRDYAGQIEHVEVLSERPGKFAEPATPLPEPLMRLLAARGIEQLYSHQVAALEAARARRDLVVVTGTASGKTFCYNLPILESALAGTNSRALYLYPTKALAQDQLKGLLELTAGDAELAAAIRPGVYDGDTPTAQRRRIRHEANLVLSNPDMLHASVLPYHPKWADFFTDLRYIVIDEVHTYRGILGAHVSAVLRRLLRVCRHYGSEPTFLATSATIANPGELVSRLIGREVDVIDDDGSPRGRKYFALWNPAPLGVDALARRSANDDAVMWLEEAVEAEGQALAFTRTRQSAELIHRYLRDALDAKRSKHADKVRAYRGGYLPNERREIEQDLFAGRLRAVAATNALELGIDIGSLDVALLVNYPGTIASCWQQAGRSGRRHDESLAVLLAGNDPVDQYLLRRPEYFFAQSPEHAVVDPDNPYVLARHLKAAAFELPLEDDDLATFGPLSAPIIDALCREQQLAEVRGAYYHPGGQNPTIGVSLRHMSDNTFSIVLVEGGRGKTERGSFGSPSQVPKSVTAHSVLANVDSISAPELVYPEAVYLHNGETYLVRELDLNGKIAYVERRETDYYTQAVLESSVVVTAARATSDAVPRAALVYGDVDVSWQTVAFKKIKFATRENIGLGPVDIPAQQLQTTALWLTPDDSVRADLKAAGLRASEGIVGLRNLAVVALPFVAMCDSRDLGGVVNSHNTGKPTMILYDRYPGGLGYSEKGFARIDQLLEICREMVSSCPCEAGCPSCVGLPNHRPAIHSDLDLTRGHPMPDKAATQMMLELLCARSGVAAATAGV
ncbi:DEAD/DEAH box helicase [Lacipirellula limnantheis]|uniref:ATP-dependent RNA helicase DbpA n=1 Tax=Lacipirellula limnantheis TaxID=2528024 RepID=A0A517TS06_9BACT|nr:DEAD/DEAH box helicase [Lacipirellula limnantheis]QDT71157.1 ATP-dependent RNA helicase DbpA [Lacipirellula limnantheis]